MADFYDTKGFLIEHNELCASDNIRQPMDPSFTETESFTDLQVGGVTAFYGNSTRCRCGKRNEAPLQLRQWGF